MPERSAKRVKPNPEPQESVNIAPTPQIHPLQDGSTAVKVSRNTSEPPSEKGKEPSWYNRTWPRKAAPVTQVAKESISLAGNAATEAVSAVAERISPKPRSTRTPSLQATLGKRTSHRSSPADAETTKVHATPNSTPVRKSSRRKDGATAEQDEEKTPTVLARQNNKAATESQPYVDEGCTKPDTAEQFMPVEQNDKNVNNGSTASSTWLPWLSKVDAPRECDQKTSETGGETSPNAGERTTTSKAPDTSRSQDPTSADQPQETTQAGNKRGWLQVWGNERNPRPSSAPPGNRTAMYAEDAGKPVAQSLCGSETGQTLSSPQSTAPSIVASEPPPAAGQGNKSSGWVFWSRDGNSSNSTSQKEEAHQGEIAISDTPSQGKPRRTSIALSSARDTAVAEPRLKIESQVRADSPAPSTHSKKWSREVADLVPKVLGSGTPEDATKLETSKATAIGKAPEGAREDPTQPAAAFKKTSTVLVPSLHETLNVHEHPSLLQQLSRLLYYTKTEEPKRLSLTQDPPRIRNALAIGVHGYFPTPLIRSVLGQPTGTSIKFADMAARSIQNWTKAHGYECQVKTAALEGEGKIIERIQLLWKLLLNWIDEIRNTDFVLVACHSQGVPVAIMLVAKLIEFGCVNSARIGICAMAGVNMGPFQEFKSRWISGSAGELFEFSDPLSKVSTLYLAALETVLNFGVRVAFIGSIDDQLVSLESSLFTPISHPYIYRAVSIDSRVHAPSFLSHLVGFTLKLRNYGVPDHGLIRELSSPLAGSLYTGEGHSRIYEDEEVYDLAVEFALETNDIPNASLTQRPTVASVSNPYILPFAMRGVLEEDFVKSELQSEASNLLREFDDWKPTTKVLKDVKFRLEGIKSKM